MRSAAVSFGLGALLFIPADLRCARIASGNAKDQSRFMQLRLTPQTQNVAHDLGARFAGRLDVSIQDAAFMAGKFQADFGCAIGAHLLTIRMIAAQHNERVSNADAVDHGDDSDDCGEHLGGLHQFGLGLALGLIADVRPINIRAKLFAGDAATCGSLNFNAALCRYRPKSLCPLVHRWSGHLKQSGQSRLRSKQSACALDGGFLCFHATSVALLYQNIKPCFTRV